MGAVSLVTRRAALLIALRGAADEQPVSIGVVGPVRSGWRGRVLVWVVGLVRLVKVGLLPA